MNELDKVAHRLAIRLNQSNNVAFIRAAKDSGWVKRITFARRDINAHGKWRNSMIQSLGCLELISVDMSECCEAPDGRKVKRTKVKIPKPIDSEIIPDFAYVGSPNGAVSYQPTSDWKADNFAYSGVPPLFPFYIYKNDYLYIIGTIDKEVLVKGVFQYPEEAAKFSHCSQSNCSTSKDAYTDLDMIDIIEKELFKDYGVPIKVEDKEVAI